MRITVCALTYKRVQGLARLLEGLAALTFEDDPPDLSVVIVDNDPERGARATCEAAAKEFRCPLKYVMEPKRGIAYARNTALDHAGDAEWLAFIDDDEVPEPGWLAALIRTQKEYDADVVCGPVVPYFPQQPPGYVIAGGFFEPQRFQNGRQRPYAFTNNVLFRGAILTEMGLRFDERWALMGCKDRHFFQRIAMAGHKIIWTNDAVVTEWIPATRANAKWLVKRWYRVGNTSSFVELDLRPKWKMLPIQLAKSAVWALIGAGVLSLGLFAGVHVRIKGRRAFAYAAGLFTGLLGIPYEEYREVHGA